MHNARSEALHVVRVTPKDCYETPAHLWRHAIAAFRLDRDAHASALNAVLPAYDTRDAPGPQPGARYWLNPAYGVRCGGIGRALAAHVWQRGCAVVALLPALLNTDWCARARRRAAPTSLAATRARARRVLVPGRGRGTPEWGWGAPEPLRGRGERCGLAPHTDSLREPRQSRARRVSALACGSRAASTRRGVRAPAALTRHARACLAGGTST